MEYMYDTYARPAELYGRGFTLYGLLPDIDVDRERALDRIGEFDLVVFGAIWETPDLYAKLTPRLRRRRVAVLDGHDRIEAYPFARPARGRPGFWRLAAAHLRHTYFKREITWPARPVFPKPISFGIPEEKIAPAAPAKTKDFNAHIVDPEVAAAVGGRTSYAFGREEDYYADLQASRFGITAKRAGWDALRHYEIAANGSVPCFRDLDRKPGRCAPHGLDDSNCVVYSSWDDLRGKLDVIGDDRYAQLQAGALGWARANTTRRRAEQLLARMGLSATA